MLECAEIRTLNIWCWKRSLDVKNEKVWVEMHQRISDTKIQYCNLQKALFSSFLQFSGMMETPCLRLRNGQCPDLRNQPHVVDTHATYHHENGPVHFHQIDSARFGLNEAATAADSLHFDKAILTRRDRCYKTLLAVTKHGKVGFWIVYLKNFE